MTVLDPRIEADSAPVGRLPLCHVRWMRDARYPWALLVPERPGVREIHELDERDRHVLIDESALVASALSRIVSAHKMNVAAIGNVVAQLHVHVVARFPTDDAWPRPVWGVHPALPYDPETLEARVASLRNALAPRLVDL
ncbi:HIT domain-containing protein [Sandaracinus amylolyticus]|uniref:Diadenosine tetraphosphate (Ap4A) hydrolase n=1 Tax=Sandaracinus amylolyticus TaxID=927083 RepID=A0A0F6YFJ1_9BACT|nr:HIT family protein [Sandaracinus amylolyticus]AKF03626.1 Diadenosine tetraphosphate (Ap4A) hydrolase [Sandaracinus amylolyticus]